MSKNEYFDFLRKVFEKVIPYNLFLDKTQNRLVYPYTSERIDKIEYIKFATEEIKKLKPEYQKKIFQKIILSEGLCTTWRAERLVFNSFTLYLEGKHKVNNGRFRYGQIIPSDIIANFSLEYKDFLDNFNLKDLEKSAIDFICSIYNQKSFVLKSKFPKLWNDFKNKSRHFSAIIYLTLGSKAAATYVARFGEKLTVKNTLNIMKISDNHDMFYQHKSSSIRAKVASQTKDEQILLALLKDKESRVRTYACYNLRKAIRRRGNIAGDKYIEHLRTIVSDESFKNSYMLKEMISIFLMEVDDFELLTNISLPETKEILEIRNYLRE